MFGIIQGDDTISFDCTCGNITLQVEDDEIQRRIHSRKSSTREQEILQDRGVTKGYRGLYARCVNQAESGADFDLLTASGPALPGDQKKFL